MDFQSHRSLQFPRTKVYLSSLKVLMQGQVIVQPEVEIRKKLFPQATVQNMESSIKRAQSSILLNQLRKHSLSNIKKQGNQATKKQKKVQSYRPNQSSAYKKAMEKQSALTGQSLPLSNLSQSPSKSLSNFTDYPIRYKPQVTQSNSLIKQYLDRPFLRKGSSIQKHVVINLLRSKLLRQRQQNKKKEYSNKQIIKMINIFKGVSSQNDNYKKTLQDDQMHRSKENFRRQMIKEIKGWDHDPQDMYDHYQKVQHQPGQLSAQL